MKRRDDLMKELSRSGKTVDAKMVNDGIESEIKSGKLKLQDRVARDQIWQMVIPYATGASLSLPEEPTPSLPWVMSSGSPMAHIMIEHRSAPSFVPPCSDWHVPVEQA